MLFVGPCTVYISWSRTTYCSADNWGSVYTHIYPARLRAFASFMSEDQNKGGLFTPPRDQYDPTLFGPAFADSRADRTRTQFERSDALVDFSPGRTAAAHGAS